MTYFQHKKTSFDIRNIKSCTVNPQTVGMDSGVKFCLSNFLEDILQPTSSKMSQTSNLGL